MRKVYIDGLLYDLALEIMLKGLKKKVTECILRHNLLPALDICCGTGVQCHRIWKIEQDIYGLDRDFRMIQYAASKYPEIPFMCADAVNIPFRNSCVKGTIISYSLHDKSPEMRIKMLEEAKRILKPDGKIVFVDFENPWSRRSRLGGFLTSGIERMAGQQHFKNGKQFLDQGGLRAFIKQNELVEIERFDVELAHTSIVVAQFSHFSYFF